MIRIKDSKSKTTLKAAFLLSVFLLLAAVTGSGQQLVNLTAGPTTTTMPDGTVLPMWGYTCGAAVSGSTATCAPLTGSSSGAATGALGGIYVISGGSGYTADSTTLTVTITPNQTVAPTTPAVATAVVNSAGQIVGVNVTNHGAGYTAAPTVTVSGGTGAVLAAAPAWSPVAITIPFGATGGLQINLTNALSFGTGAGQSIPTSIVIIGQVGGGLGATPTTTGSPSHATAQGCPTWFIAQQAPGQPCPSATATANQAAGIGGNPPTQGPRVQSMGTEVAAGTTTSGLTWGLLKPGTYLLESGTHPSIQVPMGLIGMLVVTEAPGSGATGTSATNGIAYPAVAANTTNAAAQAAVPAVNYGAEVPLEFSEIDPVQNKSVDIAVRNPVFSETRVWSGLPQDPQGNPGCGNPQSGTLYQSCYPPAVNYTPFYYLINGQAFDKTNPGKSLYAATAGPATTGISGNVLLRFVNAGLKMHVPSVVGSQTTGFSGNGTSTTVGGFTLIAEDGNPVPNATAPRVKTEVFMAAGKTYDVMVNLPSASLPVFDRELSLSANSSVRDAGMLAYVGVNGSALPSFASGVAGSGTATANPDTYNSILCASAGTSCQPLVISDPSKGVIANDINVYGVTLTSAPAFGALTCNAVSANPVPGICANGTFTYTPVATGWAADTFQYCANGTGPATTPSICTTVALNASTLTGSPTAINLTWTAQIATYIKIPSPGILQFNKDPNYLPLSINAPGVTLPACSGAAPATGCGTVDAQGGFTVQVAPHPGTTATASFTYQIKNSLGATSSALVTINFPAPSNLQVYVIDAQQLANCAGNPSCIAGLSHMPDYRWIIEEDKTFWVDPNCTTNTSVMTPNSGCAPIVGTAGSSTIPTFGVNFHTSDMGFVAQGCTGPLSCESGQTMLDTRVGSATLGQHIPAVCDLGNGACRPDPNCTGTTPCATGGTTQVNPSEVALDPRKRYFISILPGDAANPFPSNVSVPDCPANGGEAAAGNTGCGHTMSGVPIPAVCNVLLTSCTTSAAYTQPVTVPVLPTPLPTGKLSVIVFEDDYPLNGEQDGGGGNATVAPIEPGLGGFNVVLWDTYGGLGDVTGQDTYDMFNMPLSNSLDGTIDPVTNLNACPISAQSTTNTTQAGITGMIVTCPKYESDGATLSPLAGQAVIANLMPEKFSAQAYPGADRIARGEQWVQTNTLDGQHPHDAFIPIGGPSYFQEYGPAGYHVMIGFANPAIINARHGDVCNGIGSPGAVGPCTNTITGQVDVQRLSRTPDQRLYPSGSRDALAWTQCWVSLGDPDGEDFEFTFCDANGNFTFTNVPGGNWRITMGDQWNDQIIDGLSIPANVGCSPNGALSNQTTTCPGGQTLNLGNIGVQQWQSNIYTRTCIDDNKNGICDPGEIGIPFIYTMIHYRDGHNANSLTTDFNGVANFNESFPLFNWYVIESDSTRYKTTGIHTVYDAGGPADGSPSCGPGNGARACGASTAYNFLSNTYEAVPLPADLSVPGAVYCAKADCMAEAAAFATATSTSTHQLNSTGRIDSPLISNGMEGWSGLTGQSNYVEFGKAPYASCPPACATVTSTPPGSTSSTSSQVGENGGVYGTVVYASTRPFDDASQMIQQPWEPNVPGVTVNLYKEGFAADGVTPTLTMVDTTVTGSWDNWAQGFYPNYTDATSGTPLPYMNCPGQGTNTTGTANQDLFYFTLYDQPNYLDWYSHTFSGTALNSLPYNSQFKCYDAMHIGDQLQPAPYDGKYYFPSSLGISPATGKLVTTVGSTNGVTASMAGTNCTICVKNPDTTDAYRVGTPMLPPGKYVVETIMPPGYEVYKEEDKNLLIGDNFIAPATQQFAGLGADIFILPDQASVASIYDESGAGYNGTNYQNSTTGEGLNEELSGVPGFPGYTDPVWPCVGEMRVVPDYLSEFPLNLETAPYAGATRPLCDRKEVTLTDQMAVNARFFVFTSAHIASKYTGVITDDYTSEFDPFAPQFGEKFGPPNLPVSTKDYLGNELSRVWADHWGAYDGLTFSSWDVNPPNITGYSPTMLTQCMNDPGPIMVNGQLVNDPLYNPAYSDFCYINPFMPGLTTYNDTPVVPTEAFVGAGYNNVDCSYPDTTPAIAEVDGDGIGPWVASVKGGVTALSLTAGGTGYTSAPTVAFTGGGTGATATAVISGGVAGVSVTGAGNTGGSGYTTAPTVTISGGGGSGATATAHLTSGVVTSVTINSAGSGYTSAPTVSFTAPPRGTGHTTAHGTATISASVVSVTLTADGSGYTAPTVTFTGGGGTGATATAAASTSGGTLTITSLGDQQVNNSAYSGPSANTAPFNLKTLTRHYGFGTQCTAVGTNCTAVSSVTIGGKSATISSWSDTSITVTVPSGVANCAKQQQNQYGGSTAQCGELVITAGNGKQSIDAVTVTIGGKAPTHVSAGTTIQSAIDAAAPGDLLIIDPTCTATAGTTTTNLASCTTALPTGATAGKAVAAHNEMLLMWKPVRLQGVGAATSIIDANAFPAGRLLNPWRRHVNCLFGLTISGVPSYNGGASPNVPFDSPSDTANNGKPYSCPDTGWNYYTTPGALNVPQIDRLPLEAVTGWDATVNGNLAEQLQEPSLMGAYEGAGITVLAKGVWTSPGESPWTDGSEPGAFPPDALLLQDVPVGPDDEGASLGPQYSYCFTTTATGSTTTELAPNPYPSNYECNPSMIDGLTIRDSSQGGGGIFVHGWAHYLQIANDRVYNNAGTLSGGITVGQGEFPIALNVVDQEGSSGLLAPVGEFVPDNPPSCLWTPIIGLHLPYCLDIHVNVHNNYITSNSSLGDELFSGTLAGGGGASFCTGSDYYMFQYNWVCGNLSSAEGGGVAHIGFIYDGDIEHNTIALNQSTNPTIPTNGGGLIVMGTPDTDPICGIQLDADCPPGLSDGIGPNLVINANLIQANTAESGAGGGIRFQQVNGTDISTFPNGCAISGAGALAPSILGACILGKPAYDYWNSASVTNNIIVNNVSGWDGAGVSLEDSLNVSIINNTIASNDSLASSGVLTQSLGTPEASAPAGSGVCTVPGGSGATQASCPQSAGLTAEPNESQLTTSLSGLTITCPTGMPNCSKFSNPLLENNLIWQNRSFIVGVSGTATAPSGTGTLNQQNLVKLYDAVSGTLSPTQTAWGQCATGVSYWDIGVRGDTGPTNHSSGFTLAPTYSVMENTAGYLASNSSSSPTFTAQYCNGSRVPPNCTVADGCGGPSGYGVPPGIADATSPNPVFTLTPSATVDEGNNWVNVSWGPMALSDDSLTGGTTGNYGAGNPFANYAPTSTAVNIVPQSNLPTGTFPDLKFDFFGTARPTTGNVTAGAIELSGTGGGGGGGAAFSVSPSPLAFGTEPAGGTSAALAITVTNTGTTALAGGLFTFGGGTPQPFSHPGQLGACGATLAIGAHCTYNVVFHPSTGTANATTFSRTLTVTYTGATGTGTPVTLTGTVEPAGVLTFSTATNGTLSGTGTRTLTFTIPSPRAAVTSVVTITNTGTAGSSLTITAETLNQLGALYSITGTTCSTATPLAQNGTCTVSIEYATPATRPIIPDLGSMTVSSSAGTSTLILSAQ